MGGVLGGCAGSRPVYAEASSADTAFSGEVPLPEESLSREEPDEGEETPAPRETAPSDTEKTRVPAAPAESAAPTGRLPASSASAGDAVKALCEKYRVVGMSLAVFRGQQIVYTQSYGMADRERNLPADENTKYRIASISKAVSGMLAVDLAEQGRLDLNADVSRYLGITLRSPYYPDVPVTTWQLLTHTSGMVDTGDRFERATDTTPFATLKEVLDGGGNFHKGRPGTRYSYSNFGAGLLAGVIEGATGQRFYDYAREALLAPMGLDAAYLHTQIRDTESLASIYRGKTRTVDLRTWNRVESAYDAMPIGQMYLLAHGDLILSAVDLSKLAMLLCGDGSYGGRPFIHAAAVEKINTKQVRAGANDGGLTLIMSDTLVKGRRLHGHSGQAYGMVGGMFYDPDDQTGVVFLTNGCSTEKDGDGNYKITSGLLNLCWSRVL